MLSDHASKIVLEGLFGMSANKDAQGKGQGRRGIIINGHDHAGCDVIHYIRQPGVDDVCQAVHVKREDAYWPTSTADNTLNATSMDIDGVDINVVAANDTVIETNMTASETSSESASEPTPEPAPEASAPPKWRARRFPPRPYDIMPDNECISINDAPHIREITLRSMMGEYSGYAGFLSAWFDESKGEKGEWVFEFSSCGVGVQHWWWGVHIIDSILLLCLLVGAAVSVCERVSVDASLPGITMGRKKQELESAKDSTETKTIVHATRGRTSSVTEVTKRRI
jgi:hypothetical protein